MPSRRSLFLQLCCLLLASALVRPVPSAGPTTGDLFGTVRDGGGRVLANVAVSVVGGPTAGSVRSDSKGVYRLADLEPGKYDLVAEKGGYVAAHAGGLQVAANTELRQDFKLEWSDPRTGGIEVRIQDVSAQPLAGATVDLFAGSAFRTRATTDDAGLAFFTGLRAGAYSVTANRPGYSEATSGSLRVRTGGPTLATLSLRRDAQQSGAISGVVRGTDLRPIFNARVALVGGPQEGETTTDFSGRYQLPNLVPGTGYAVQVTAAGFATQTRGGLTVQSNQSTLASFMLLPNVPQKGSLLGTVRDESGTPVPLATVRIRVGPEIGRDAITNGDGLYVFEELEPGRNYAISAEASGYAPAGAARLRVVAGETTVQDLTLRARTSTLGTITGTVQEAGSGLNLADVVVEIVAGPSTGLATLTDGSGRYTLEGVLPDRNYTLRFSKEGYQPFSVPLVAVTAGGRTTANAELTAASTSVGSIRGTVRKSTGGVLAGAEVTLFEGPTSPLKTTTGQDGTFSFANLRAGEGYALRVEKKGYVKQERTGLEVAEDRATEIAVTLKPGKVSGSIQGTVVDLLQRPIAGARVRVLEGPDLPAEVTTDEKGKFLFDGLTQGLYRLEASANGYLSEEAEDVSVRPKRATRVTFQLLRP